MDEKTREHVKRAVDAAPPLTEEQRQRIARLLQDGRKTLADLPAPDPVSARRLLHLLNKRAAIVDSPVALDVEVKP